MTFESKIGAADDLYKAADNAASEIMSAGAVEKIEDFDASLDEAIESMTEVLRKLKKLRKAKTVESEDDEDGDLDE